MDRNIIPIEKVCILGEQVALANEDASSGQEKYHFMDDPVTIELVLDIYCTNHVCYLLSLFSEMREAPINTGILGIGGIIRPEGIGTITFKVTDSTGETQQIEL